MKKDLNIRELAGLISQRLSDAGIEAVLVGGACVSIYSEGKYVSADLDFVSDESIRNIEKVIEPLGYTRTPGRHFEKKGSDLVVEFLTYPVAIGKESPIRKFGLIKTKHGSIKILTRTDCVKDRLSAYYHWNDSQSLAQAIMVAKAGKVSMAEIKRWSENENMFSKYSIFLKELRKTKK